MREFSEADLKWIKEFQKVMKKAPKHLFMFVGNGIQIYSERRMNAEMSVDQNVPNINVTTPMETDGGDY